MSATTAVIAANLLPFVTDDDTFADLAQMAPSTKVKAARYARLHHTRTGPDALTQAQEAGDDVVLLAKLAERATNDVINVLVANPHTPVATLRVLAERSVKKKNKAALAQLAASALEVEELLSLIFTQMPTMLDKNFPEHQKLIGALAARIATDNNPEHYRAVALGPSNRLRLALTQKLVFSRNFDTLDAYLAAIPIPAVKLCLTEVLEISCPLSDAFVSLLCSPAGDGLSYTTPRAHPMSLAAAQRLVNDDREQLRWVVISSLREFSDAFTTDHLPQLLQVTTAWAAQSLLSRPGVAREAPAADVLRLVQLTVSSLDNNERNRLFRDVGHRLPAPDRMALLRQCNASVAADWLTGKLASPPSVTDVKALVVNPGLTLQTPGSRVKPSDLRSHAPVRDVTDYLQRFAAAFTQDCLTREGVMELLNVVPQVVFAQVSSSAGVPAWAAYLGQRLDERFPQQKMAWVVAAQLIGSVHVTTVDEFLILVEHLLPTA